MELLIIMYLLVEKDSLVIGMVTAYTEYPELFQQQRTFKSVKANTNTVCAVGLDYNSPIYSNAVIVLGKEINLLHPNFIR